MVDERIKKATTQTNLTSHTIDSTFKVLLALEPHQMSHRSANSYKIRQRLCCYIPQAAYNTLHNLTDNERLK